MFACKPDYEKAQKRVDAFWNFEETDRPLALIHYRKQGAITLTKKDYPDYESEWLDLEQRVASAVNHMENTVFYADSMPVFMPNLGPEILSAMAGCPYFYGKDTTWTEPCIKDWGKDADKAVIDINHPLCIKLDEYTKLLLERAKGNFIVGLSDFHPGGDHIAALRDPQLLATDLYDYPNYVKAKIESSTDEYFKVYDHFRKLIKDAGMPVSSWIPLTSDSMYIPSCDFSYMISKKMFDEFFLDGLIHECRHYGTSIYHLDGPGALRHMESILSIPELNAIQWVPGAGNEQIYPWLDVFKTIIAAGKSVIAYPGSIAEIDYLMDNLPARGLCLQMSANDEEEAEALLKHITRWPKKK